MEYNAAELLLDTLHEAGIDYLFSNLGSDHPTIIEGLAKARAAGKNLSEVILCPHEYVGMSAAHGCYLVSGRPQAVIVHTDVGTQNLGGSLHNAFRSRVPVFIFAGETPYTLHGELLGSRNTHINYLQNVFDQAGIVRSYVKWHGEINSSCNVRELVHRALQVARSDPAGPVYLTGAREALEQPVPAASTDVLHWPPVEKTALTPAAVDNIVQTLLQAKRPLIVTSYIGRNKTAVDELRQFAETLSLPVVEATPCYMNFPTGHPLHMGFSPGEYVADADAVLVIDTDVPWLMSLQRPGRGCKILSIDTDPIKRDIPLWTLGAERYYQADSCEALQQLNYYLDSAELPGEAITQRRNRIHGLHAELHRAWEEAKNCPEDDIITPEWLTTCLDRAIDDDAIVLNETITNAGTVSNHLSRRKSGTLFGNGGSALGWSGGAALGIKLSAPDRLVVALCGDGSYFFSVPSTVHWMSRRYNAPFLTVIYDNRGWNATKNNVLKVHPDGIAHRDDRYWINFEQPADLAGIAAAAGGAYAATVDEPSSLPEIMEEAVDVVRNGRSAVLDVKLKPASQQPD